MTSLYQATGRIQPSCFSLYGQWHEPTPDIGNFLPSLNGEKPATPPSHQLYTRSIGSAFAWSNEGILVTCAHVVRGVRGFIAEDMHGNQHPARLIGFCTVTDIAVLKIDTHTIPTTRTAPTPQQGDAVFTFGHPLMDELAFTLSGGAVAFVDRYLPDAPPMPHLQLDISIYPGNSGGALFNEHGQLVGMVRGALIPDSDPVTRIPLAVGLDVLKVIVPRLLENGHGYLPPDLGVSLSKLRPPLAAALNLQPFSGLMVDEVVAGSLAEQSGLQVGDILTRINGLKCNSLAALQWAMLSSVGRPLHLSVLRNGPTLVRLSRIEAVPAPATPRPRRYQPAFGLKLRGQRTGVRVLSVHPGSAAALSGLIGGEVLHAYQNPDSGAWVPVNRRGQILALCATHKGRSLSFLIRDNNGTTRQVGLSF